MKRLITLMALGASAFMAQAQQTVQGSGFLDNWSVGLVGGGVVPITNSNFIKDVRATYGVELGKQITPVFGLGVQFMAANNVSSSANVFDKTNLSFLGKVNLSNWICGYNGTPRLFELELAGGIGWGREYYPSSVADDNNFLTSKVGLNFNFNLGEQKAWTVSLKPSFIMDMEEDGPSRNVSFSKDRLGLEVLAGVTYHFKNRNNSKHYMTLHRAYDQAEVDGLNAKINDLRNQANEKDAALSNKDAQIKDLQNALNECRNQKPTVQTVTKSSNSLEQTITFRQGKSTIDASQYANVERIATFLRNHKNATVVIKGYASPEGSAEVNARIALARAECVKNILIKKYRIEASRIQAEGQGVGDMFSEPDWNRVSICTINEAE